MTFPSSSEPIPAQVKELAGDTALVPVWRNDYGGLTFRTGDGRYIKWGPLNAESSMLDEARRMTWAGRFTPVPHVLDVGSDEESEWLITRALPGRSAVDPRWVAHPRSAVRAVGEGLRALHDALPVAECPFDWSVPARIANAEARGIEVPDELRTPPPVDLLVVCHADACCPNTLVSDDGTWLAHVDLGLLGVGDRWGDIAVAVMSTEWDFGAGWDDELIAAYGVEPDHERLTYYRDLWNAT